MMRTSAGLLFALSLAFGQSAQAADKPMIRFQAQSIEQLHEKIYLTYELAASMPAFLLGELFGDGEAPAQGGSPWNKFYQKKAFDPKLLPGVDLKKPLLIYGNLDAKAIEGNFETSEVVVLVPIKAEKDFLELLKLHEIGADAGEGGLYKLKIPDSPMAAFLRFVKGHACITLMTPNAIDPKKLLDPIELIDPKQTQAISMNLDMGRLPKEIKQFISDHILVGIKEVKKEMDDPPSPPEKIVAKYLEPYAVRLQKQLLMETKTLNLAFDLDSKTGDAVVQITFDGQAGTDLIKDIAAYKTPTNAFGSLTKRDSTALSLTQMPFFAAELRDMATELIDETAKVLAKEDAMPEGMELTKLFLSSLRKTVQSNTLETIQILTPPDKDNHYTAALGLHLDDAASLNLALVKLVKALPADYAKHVKLDSVKIPGAAVHRINLKDLLPDDQETKSMLGVFGKEKDLAIHIAVGQEAIVVAAGPESEKILTEILQAKRAATPMIMNEFTGKYMAEFVRIIAAGNIPPQMLAGMEKLEKVNYFTLNSTGGESMKIEVRTGILSFLALIYMREAAGP